MKKVLKKKIPRNSYFLVMMRRHRFSQKMRDRRMRRAKDAKKSWKKEEW